MCKTTSILKETGEYKFLRQVKATEALYKFLRQVKATEAL